MNVIEMGRILMLMIFALQYYACVCYDAWQRDFADEIMVTDLKIQRLSQIIHVGSM